MMTSRRYMPLAFLVAIGNVSVTWYHVQFKQSASDDIIMLVQARDVGNESLV